MSQLARFGDLISYGLKDQASTYEKQGRATIARLITKSKRLQMCKRSQAAHQVGMW